MSNTMIKIFRSHLHFMNPNLFYPQ